MFVRLVALLIVLIGVSACSENDTVAPEHSGGKGGYQLTSSQSNNPMDSAGIIHTLMMESVRARAAWWDTTYIDSIPSMVADFLIGYRSNDTVTSTHKQAIIDSIGSQQTRLANYLQSCDSVNDVIENLSVSTTTKNVYFRLFDALIESEDKTNCDYFKRVCDTLADQILASGVSDVEKVRSLTAVSIGCHSAQYWVSRLNSNGHIYKVPFVQRPDTTKRQKWTEVVANDVFGACVGGIGGMVEGAISGAIVGSLIPGVGTVAVAAVTAIATGAATAVVEAGHESLSAALGNPKIGEGGSWYDTTPKKNPDKGKNP